MSAGLMEDKSNDTESDEIEKLPENKTKISEILYYALMCSFDLDESFEISNFENTFDSAPLTGEIDDLLISWKLYDDLGTLFKEQQINMNSLIHIKESDINLLIPSLSSCIQFKRNLAEWRLANGHPLIPVAEELSMPLPVMKNKADGNEKKLASISCSLPSIPTVQSTKEDITTNSNVGDSYKLFEPEILNQIKEILNNDNSSAMAINHFRSNNSLNYHHRKNIVSTLIDYFIQNKIRLMHDDFKKITEKLVEIFPSENKLFYYIEGNAKSKSRGSLYISYFRRINKLRKEEFVKRFNETYTNSGSERN